MKDPKPFHIGTPVRNIHTDGLATVEAALIRRGGMYVFIDDDEYEPYGYEANLWAHADDGTPLGDWVPIKDDAPDAFDGNYGTSCVIREPAITIAQANAIIRGEVAQ